MKTKSDFYEILGVPRSASAAEIKSAYRKRAKEIHPDINSHPNATADFQRLQEAFSVLGSPERKALYDQGDYAAATDPSTKATEADLEPMQCDACGCISAQLRFVLYDRVTSILLASYKQHLAGVFCPSCACKKLFFSTLITGAIGWLGFLGFFWSIAAVARNLAGGKHPPGLNAFILGRQSLYLLRQGKNDVAHLLAKESIAHFKKCRTDDRDYSLGEIGASASQSVLGSTSVFTGKLRSSWVGWSRPGRSAFYGLAIPIAFWVFFLGNNLSSKEQSAKRQSTYTQSTTSANYTSHHKPDPVGPVAGAEQSHAQTSFNSAPPRLPLQTRQTTQALPKYVRPALAPNGYPWPSFPSEMSGYAAYHNDGHSKVTVDNSRCSSDVCVKLVSLDYATPLPVRTFYIPAYCTFTCEKVRKGNYDIRYRDLHTGKLSKSEPFNLIETITNEGINYSTISLTLYSVANGNMNTEAISEDEF
ncbi:MAG: hypothetical protein RLZ22_12 [Verrucomicrobiota bacterium]|jgi:hypothetical protein